MNGQDPVIVFDRVWKKFQRGQRHDSLRDLVPAMAQRLMGRTPPVEELGNEEFWAVQDVSFEVRRGEALGIIGPNGAGKSTSLKLLTRILRPTRGACHVRGRSGALIEVAAGFHPDLTGRENIFLQGAIMGMSTAEVTRKVDEIISFAGIDSFVDTPVKRYSSGMNARLGFSIAAHLEPDALIIDEVLSVGDAAFQARCLERMLDFKRRGAAIVFVSHNLQAVQALCERALYLKHKPIVIGPTTDVLHEYVKAATTTTLRHLREDAPVVALSSQLVDDSGNPVSIIAPGQPLTLLVDYRVQLPLTDFHFGVLVHRSTDLLNVYDGNVTDVELGLTTLEPGQEFRVAFHFNANLVRGQYHLDVHVTHNPTTRVVERVNPAGVFSVDEQRTWAGIADIALRPRLVAREVSAPV